MFYIYEIFAQKLQSFVLALRLFGAKILDKKGASKTLMKLTAGFVFKHVAKT